MTPVNSAAGRRNLRAGIKKMAKAMTPAAKVRRDFQLGRPPKPPVGGDVPIHRTVVWQKAMQAILTFQSRMADAGLDPTDAQAVIVYVLVSNPTTPQFLAVNEEGKEPEEVRNEAFKTLGRDDVIVLGLAFEQLDWQGGADGQLAIATFPYRFRGLSPQSEAVLKLACAVLEQTRPSRVASRMAERKKKT